MMLFINATIAVNIFIITIITIYILKIKFYNIDRTQINFYYMTHFIQSFGLHLELLLLYAHL